MKKYSQWQPRATVRMTVSIRCIRYEKEGYRWRSSSAYSSDIHKVLNGISWCFSSRSYSDSLRRAGGECERTVLQRRSTDGGTTAGHQKNVLGLLHIPTGRRTGTQSS